MRYSAWHYSRWTVVVDRLADCVSASPIAVVRGRLKRLHCSLKATCKQRHEARSSPVACSVTVARARYRSAFAAVCSAVCLRDIPSATRRMRQATPNAVCSIFNPVVQSVGSRASQRQDLAWPIALIDEPRINDRHRSVAAIGSVKLSNGGGRIMLERFRFG